MCPPPAEPIRPVGLVDGSEYVDRAGLTERVHRRRPRDQDEPHEDGRRRRQAEDATRQPIPAAIRDPRAYDDHGRHPDAVDEPDTPHVDATA